MNKVGMNMAPVSYQKSVNFKANPEAAVKTAVTMTKDAAPQVSKSGKKILAIIAGFIAMIGTGIGLNSCVKSSPWGDDHLDYLEFKPQKVTSPFDTCKEGYYVKQLLSDDLNNPTYHNYYAENAYKYDPERAEQFPECDTNNLNKLAKNVSDNLKNKLDKEKEFFRTQPNKTYNDTLNFHEEVYRATGLSNDTLKEIQFLKDMQLVIEKNKAEYEKMCLEREKALIEQQKQDSIIRVNTKKEVERILQE